MLWDTGGLFFEGDPVAWQALRGLSKGCAPRPPLCRHGNTVRNFPTHGQLPAAQGSPTTVSRSDIRLILTF
jgi:hypothetical protein